MPPISPTARTTSWASIICATTWPSTRQEMVQRGHNFVIVDEVDSILIDEARTPLIISGKGEESTKLYEMADLLRLPPEEAGVCHRSDDKEIQDELRLRLHRRGEGPHRLPHGQRASPRPRSFSAWRISSDVENTTLVAPHQSGHEGPRRHEARYRLCRQGRPGHHRR